MAFFGQKTYFKNFFLGSFCPPIKVISKKWVKMASKLVFIRGALKGPPATRDAFPMLPQVGLKEREFQVRNDNCYFFMFMYYLLQSTISIQLPSQLSTHCQEYVCWVEVSQFQDFQVDKSSTFVLQADSSIHPHMYYF